MSVKKKNPHAVALGRLGAKAGGKIGGPARALALSSKERQEIARAGGLASGKARARRKKAA
jgi:hypothetical protein